jgi:hypothetical protein
VGLQVDIDAGLRGRVRIGLAVVEAVSVREADPALSEEIDGTAGELRRRHAGRAPSEAVERRLFPAHDAPEGWA